MKRDPSVLAPHVHIAITCYHDVFQFVGDRVICGCPECCARLGYTAVYSVEDYRPGVTARGWWGKTVCEEKLALLVKERIVPGWPGGAPWKEGKRIGRVKLDEEERCIGWVEPGG